MSYILLSVFCGIVQNLNSVISVETEGFNLFSLNGIVKGFVSIGFLNLSVSYALRYIMIKVIVLLSPFAFLSLSLKNTSWVFKSWLKIFISLLLLQILVPIILIVSFSLSSANIDIFSKILYVGCIYSLIRANSYVREFMGGLSTDINMGISNFKSFFSGGN